jgi:glycosyltransferase involved in cell wall biosynthesis
MRVLYIYAGERTNSPKGEMGKDFPDTQYYGINHLKKFGIDTEYKEFKDIPLLGKLKSLPFGAKHALTTFYFSLVGKYDVIFGPSLIYGLLLNRLFGLRQKTVLLDISLSRMLRVNEGKPGRSRLIRFALDKVSHVISLSNFQRELLVKKVPSLQSRSSVALFGIDVGFYEPKYEGREDFILSAGRDNGRDYRTVYKTAELMPTTRFVVVASERNVKHLGIPPRNVEVHIDLPHKALYSKLLGAKALFLATYGDMHKEGSDCSGQTVLLEAMASGTPVVVSRKKYLKEYVIEGKEALLVEAENPQDAKDALETLSHELAFSIAKSARMRAEKDFTTERFAKDLSDVIKTL